VSKPPINYAAKRRSSRRIDEARAREPQARDNSTRAATPRRSNVTIEGCVLRGAGGAGIKATGANVDIKDSLIRECPVGIDAEHSTIHSDNLRIE
jgi:hypothetical protein